MVGVVRRYHLLNAKLATIDRAAAEVVAAHSDARTARNRAALKQQTRHDRLRIVHEARRVTRVLLTVDAHLDRHAPLAERSARSETEVVNQVHVVLGLARTRSKADAP